MNPSGEYLTVAARGWTETRRPARTARPGYRPRLLLVIDTETRTDPAQALLFGSARLCRLRGQDLHVEAEVLFHADDLPATDPAGHTVLRVYARRHGLPLLSRAGFVEGWLARYGYPRRGPKRGRPGPAATLVFFNAPFDLSRLAEDHGDARGGMAGGFSFRVWPTRDGKENSYRPRVTVKHLDSKKAISRFSTVRPAGGAAFTPDGTAGFRGHFLDLRTLIWSLTNQAVSLSRACDMFAVAHPKTATAQHGVVTERYVDYNRRDVLATAELAARVLAEFDTHPVDLQPTKSYSPASIAKAYLRTLGVTPMLDRPGVPTDPGFLGAATSAFYGGRAEAHIRNTPMPVSVCDFTAMYPTVNTLMRLWDLLTASRVDRIDRTEALRAELADLTVADCLDPARWPGWVGFAQVQPDGEVLPVRAGYTGRPGEYNLGVNRLHSPQPLWYSIPDLVAATLLTGRPPRILRAVGLRAGGGRLAGLRPVKLAGLVQVDPAREDFFRTTVEQRQRIKTATVGHPGSCGCSGCRGHRFLKVLANAGSYGIFVEMLRTDRAGRRPVTVHGAHETPWAARTAAVETAREYCYPPVGACITGAARLLLAVVESLVTAAGGSWLLADTDSLAIVATEPGGPVACPGGPHRTPDGRPAVLALSSAQVEQIRAEVNRLNPYHRAAVPDLLKREYDGHGYAISAKRYTLFGYDQAGRPVIEPARDKWSEHGLGLHLNPTDVDSTDRDWIRQVWQYLLDRAHGLNPTLPGWVDRPALSRLTVSTPHVLRPFHAHNRGRPYPEQVKPFNFVLTVAERAHHDQPEPPARLLAPYSADPARWAAGDWYDLHHPAGPPRRIVTEPVTDARQVRVESFRQVIARYRAHPEEKAAGPDGRPCQPATVGLLGRRTVRLARLTHIGKESNRLEDVLHGLVDDVDDVITDYGKHDPSAGADALAEMSSRQVVALVDADARRIERILQAARAGARRDARHHIDPGLTGDDRKAAIAAHVAEIEADTIRRHGKPVRVDHKQVLRWRAAGNVRAATAAALLRVAARRAVALIGIPLADDAPTPDPLVILARWRDRLPAPADGVYRPLPRPGKSVTSACRGEVNNTTSVFR